MCVWFGASGAWLSFWARACGPSSLAVDVWFGLVGFGLASGARAWSCGVHTKGCHHILLIWSRRISSPVGLGLGCCVVF